jgi:signal transduction histidine kinase/CheY-like chemotaxis protein/ligand-binding sensor domain-containing protein/AraC-like DNA-binding protein
MYENLLNMELNCLLVRLLSSAVKSFLLNSLLVWCLSGLSVSLQAQPGTVYPAVAGPDRGASDRADYLSLGTRERLSHSYVSEILQTRDGYVWISTNEGINRYDGYTIKQYLTNDHNSLQLGDLRTRALYEDRRGRLWIGTKQEGLLLFDRVQNRFFRTHLGPKDNPKELNYTLHRILEDADGNLWMGADMSTLFKVHIPARWAYPARTEFRGELRIDTVRLSGDQRDIKHIVSDGLYLWCSLSNGRLFRVHTRTGQKIEVSLPNTGTEQLQREITGLYQDARKEVWVCHATGGLTHLSKAGNTHWPAYSHNGETAYQWLDRNGFVWIRDPLTYAVWRVAHTDFARFDPARTTPLFVSRSRSYKSFVTTADSVLMIGDVRGVRRVNLRSARMAHYLPETDISEVFVSNKGQMLVGTGGVTLRYADLLPTQPAFPQFKKGLFFQSRRGDIWVAGTKPPGEPLYLFHLDADGRFLAEFRLADDWVNPLSPVRDSPDGQVWIAAGSGVLFRFDPTTKQSYRYAYTKLVPPLRGNHSSETFGLTIGADGVIWIATEDGLIEARPRAGGVFFRCHRARTAGFGSDFITALHNDPLQPRRFLWVAAKDNGVYRFDKTTGRCDTSLTTREGLPDNTIWGLLPDQRGRIWAASNQGLFYLDARTLRIVGFSRADGVQGEIFNRKTFGQTPSGLFYAAGNNGFNLFNPDAIGPEPAYRQPKIVEIEVNNRLVQPNDATGILTQVITDTPALELAYDQNTLRLYFSTLRYDDDPNRVYRCQLEGFDPAPTNLKRFNFATYTRLPPGSYRFRVWAGNGNNFEPVPASLDIRIRSPWFWSWWSILIYLGLIGYVVYRFYQMQINRVRLREQLLFSQRETERLDELDRLKTNFFTNISHEFRTPLTLLVAPLQDLAKKYPKEGLLPLMQQNLTRLQSLINQLLDLSKLEAGYLKPQFARDDLSLFLNRLVMSFESMATSKHIDLHYEETDGPNGFVLFDADKTEKIVSNLLSNALKFTPGDASPTNGGPTIRRVVLSARFEPAGCTIRVQDSGMGIAPDRLEKIFERFYQGSVPPESGQPGVIGTGIGLALVRELVEVLNGRIGVTSRLGEGTTVEVFLPYPPESVEVMVETTAGVESEPADTSARAESTEQPILLIVEDNPELRRYIKSHFEQTYQVIEAYDGQNGVEQAIDTVPDLIICDLMMPKLDGFGLCRALKTDPRTNHIPIVMLTAKADPKDRMQGLELGADDYLLKPFSSNELQVRVRNLLDNRLRMRLKYGQNRTMGVQEPRAVSLDEQFLRAVRGHIEQHHTDPGFNVEQLAEGLNVSSSQLRRKLKALTNQTVIEFIRNYRLEKAAELLAGRVGSVSDIAFQLGFESLPYFSKVFSEKYGKKPSEWSNTPEPTRSLFLPD